VNRATGRRSRLLLALIGLAPALGCVGFCGPDTSPPTVATCDTADLDFDVDAIEIDAFQSFGGQGLAMIMLDVTYLGASPPECAEVEYTVRDLDAPGFPVVLGITEQVETEELRPGVWKTSTPLWNPWPDSARLLSVEVNSHGQSGVALVCQSGTLACDRLDGSVSLDAGPTNSDSGAEDSGTADSGADSGAEDSGAADSGTADSGTADSGL